MNGFQKIMNSRPTATVKLHYMDQKTNKFEAKEVNVMLKMIFTSDDWQ
jgi:hypothetical protein